MFFFPLPARVFVLIMGAIAFYLGAWRAAADRWPTSRTSAACWSAGSTSRARPICASSLKYRLTKWRMERMRRKFNVHRGGRDDDWERRIH